jgi:hypothetical protein
MPRANRARVQPGFLQWFDPLELFVFSVLAVVDADFGVDFTSPLFRFFFPADNVVDKELDGVLTLLAGDDDFSERCASERCASVS